MVPKEILKNKIKGQFEYSSREIFTLSDGGIIAVDFIGEIFTNANSKNNSPLLFVVPGLNSHS